MPQPIRGTIDFQPVGGKPKPPLWQTLIGVSIIILFFSRTGILPGLAEAVKELVLIFTAALRF